jgi:hypothetical protein
VADQRGQVKIILTADSPDRAQNAAIAGAVGDIIRRALGNTSFQFDDGIENAPLLRVTAENDGQELIVDVSKPFVNLLRSSDVEAITLTIMRSIDAEVARQFHALNLVEPGRA